MGSRLGMEKVAARAVGLDLTEYRRRRAMGLKWCGACTEWHDNSRFGRDVSRGDGLASTCLRSRESTRSGPTKRERRTMAAMALAWCRDCQWWLPIVEVTHGRCRPHTNAAAREYYRRNPRGSPARMRGIPRWWRGERLDEGCCYCGAPATTLDHFIPISRGGENVPGNLVPACKSCNSRKKDQDPRLWIERIIDYRNLERLTDDGWERPGAIAQLYEEDRLAATG